MGKAERVWVSGEAAGVVHFKPASARHGQNEQGAWRPRGGNLQATVGHDQLVRTAIRPDEAD